MHYIILITIKSLHFIDLSYNSAYESLEELSAWYLNKTTVTQRTPLRLWSSHRARRCAYREKIQPVTCA